VPTLYLRFLHIACYHLRFVALEALVTLAVLLASAWLPQRSRVLFFPAWRKLARNRLHACVAVFLLSLAGRIALLPIEPFPPAGIHDEFSYLLAGDTFAHGRLTNPTPPLWHHFEQFYVLMQPTFASKYGAAQPLFLALGQRWLGTPRAGVLLSMALAAASLCWMLQSYLPPAWALLGGVLAVIRISWFSYFGNSYWGGSVAMLGGCLVLGSAARLIRKPRARDGLLMAVGLILLTNSRPFEGALLCLPVGTWVIVHLWRKKVPISVWIPGATLLLFGASLTGYYFEQVTGRLMFPWVAYWQQWTICPPFLFGKPNPAVHYQFADQLHYFRDAEMAPYLSTHTVYDFTLEAVVKVITGWLFFCFPALTLPLIGLVPTLRAKRFRVLMVTLAFASVGFSTETWLQAHYVAVVTGIIYVVMLNGLRWMYAAGWRKLVRGTLAAVMVMVPVRLVVVPVNTWRADWGSQTPEIPGYEAITAMLEARPRKQLVIVRYRPNHFWGYSWINNGYDPPSQHVIWARDTEPQESNLPLVCRFQDREVWLLVPPEEGYLRAPDRTAAWDPGAAVRFLTPYRRGRYGIADKNDSRRCCP
jgi:hypothetical protein